MAANNYFGFTAGAGRGSQYGTDKTSLQSSQAISSGGYGVGGQQFSTQSLSAGTRSRMSKYESVQTVGHRTVYTYSPHPQSAYEKSHTYYPQVAQTDYATMETQNQNYQAGNFFYGFGPSTAAYSGNKNKNTNKMSNAGGFFDLSLINDYYENRATKPTHLTKTSNVSQRQSQKFQAPYNVSNFVGAGRGSLRNNCGNTYSTQMKTCVQEPRDTYLGFGGSNMNTESLHSNTSGPGMNHKTKSSNWGSFKKGFRKPQSQKTPKTPQVHYCDVCKVSCAGPQTYKEHIEGQKHKKREALLKAGNVVPQSSRGGTSLRCELCDVTCTGTDAYAAHIRGAKHQKVVKLHTKLGKPIPSPEPVVVPNPESVAVTTSSNSARGEVKMVCEEEKVAASKKVVGTPKINFVGGTMLSSMKQKNLNKEGDDKTNLIKEDDKAEIQPVGQDYLEEIKNDDGKIVSFQCKLCDCRFNDPNAKEMHMKGRRHRLQYKKKVDPELVVDSKPSTRQNKIQEGKLRRQQLREELFQRREEGRWWGEMRMLEDRLRFGEEMNFLEWQRRYNLESQSTLPPPPLPPRSLITGLPTSVFLPVVPPKRPDSSDDKHVLAKHSSIYPKEEELSAVQKLVTTTEKALKLVSDFLSESDRPKQVVDKPTIKEEDPELSKEDQQPPRVLKGVMRVGVLAKGLLLTGHLNVQLVVMCTEKPTRTLLERVADNLPKQLKVVAPEDTHEVKRCVEEAAITVSADPNVIVTVTLTSHVMRGNDNTEGASAENVKDPPDVLDRQKCLDALAALRHAKWFQVKASGLHSCVVVIRVLQNLRQRLPTWERLNSWAMELLVERVISSSPVPLSPGDALRLVFEAVAGGIFLPGGPGLTDPCEKEPVDAVTDMNNQDREDLTASAQQALRLMAFRQVHKVLGMDPLPRPKFIRRRFSRKRRRSNGPGEGTEQEDAVEKKKKENGQVQPATESQE